ncbi:FxsA protein [Chitinimonas sp. BJB300]|nr:FxsA protein [Chitinimonas sp. BJB300]TSJ89597.1 FxsA family protein [Chitinimonas sp. BJB300]
MGGLHNTTNWESVSSMFIRLLPLLGVSLLALPVLELFASIWLADEIGWWLAFWLFASALVGLGILKSWRATTAWALLDSVRAGELPLGRLFWVARTLVAALLFIFPGPISDVIGLMLILPWPGGKTIRFGQGSAPTTPDDIYEGEFTRVDESARPLPHEARK